VHIIKEDGIMLSFSTRPQILFVTPEVIFIPDRSEHRIEYMTTHNGGFDNYLSELIVDLYSMGLNVHVVQPNYRLIFSATSREGVNKKAKKLPAEFVHLTEDRAFYYSGYPDSNSEWESIKISIAFQREVIHQIIPIVQPDLIHCHDWMTGLIPPVSKAYGIPCLFSFHTNHTAKCSLSDIEDMGIDTTDYWQYLYYDEFPNGYKQIRENNPADFLLSGVLAAKVVNNFTPACLMSNVEEQNNFYDVALENILTEKRKTRSVFTFTPHDSAQYYIDIYAKMLGHPVSASHWKKEQLIDA
jgi:starch synthase